MPKGQSWKGLAACIKLWKLHTTVEAYFAGMQALESLQQESFESGEDIQEDEHAPAALRRSVALYEAARALIGVITPHYDEVAKVLAHTFEDQRILF